jgi:hypothetical protein
VRAGQPGGAGPHDRHLAAATEGLAALPAQAGINAAKIEVLRLYAKPLADEPLQRADGYGCVNGPPSALGLTGRRADTPANGGKGIGLTRDDVSVLVAALGNGLHVAASIRVDRAPHAAGHLPLEIPYVRYLDVVGLWHGEFRPGNDPCYLSYLSCSSLSLSSAAFFSSGVALASFSSTIFFLRTLES